MSWENWSEEKKYTVWSYYAELLGDKEHLNYPEWCDLMDSVHT